MSKTAMGRALVPSELALRYQNRKLFGRLGRLTALIWAYFEGHTLVVDQLIAAGARLDVQNNIGCGPGSEGTGFVLFDPAADGTSGQVHCAHLGRDEGPHARG